MSAAGGRRSTHLVEGQSLIGLRQRQSVDDVVAWVASMKPSVVAIDSPRSSAPPGQTHRPEEKNLRDKVCGIRWTPPSTELERNPYYEWIVEGLRLYDALAPKPVEVVECFPTASWRRWHGSRPSQPSRLDARSTRRARARGRTVTGQPGHARRDRGRPDGTRLRPRPLRRLRRQHRSAHSCPSRGAGAPFPQGGLNT